MLTLPVEDDIGATKQNDSYVIPKRVSNSFWANCLVTINIQLLREEKEKE